jgi:hypothetical protein
LEFDSEKIVGRIQERKVTIDNLFTVKNILETFWQFNVDVHQIFIDFSQAYDNITRNSGKN